MLVSSAPPLFLLGCNKFTRFTEYAKTILKSSVHRAAMQRY
jgi:hypothetical protein